MAFGAHSAVLGCQLQISLVNRAPWHSLMPSRNRTLTEDAEVFSHNCWDNQQLTKEELALAESIVAQHKVDPRSTALSLPDQSLAWDSFYRRCGILFFRERKWLTREFPFLTEANLKILEVGCGTGATLLALLHENPTAFIFACDNSQAAIDALNEREELKAFSHRFYAFRHDATHPFPIETVDAVLFIFSLSAIPPDQHSCCLSNAFQVLKPRGGVLCYRDYALFDLTQLRIPPNSQRCIDRNFYLRGDCTLVHFYELQQLLALLGDCWKVLEARTDSKLVVNRASKQRMNRRWNQVVLQR